ncbi:MAG: coproporphyrinogen dehydrogenase HemZ [Oscillospiraceae bacterium]|nr:coproporphyrinogen dehydrogenase HemZ [Oscillospiraceae bacterium]MBQ8594742.1 coproporphyrinogen dehydrogenase HemZ [Oscillospiraceae bacterium]
MVLIIDSHPYRYEAEALCRMFLRGRELKIFEVADIPAEDFIYTGVFGDEISVRIKMDGKDLSAKAETSEGKAAKMEYLLYEILSEITGLKPKWGTLTGIRPVKLALQMMDKGISADEVRRRFKEERLVSDEKLDLLLSTAEHEQAIRALSKPESVSMYISIPFCPSRCSYCSFTSHAIEKAAKLIPQYVDLLCEELRDTAVLMEELGLRLETVYMGGGTPTVLTPEQLDRVLSTARSSFDFGGVRELTVEAGRPDTITPGKLEVMKKNGVDRISINPQTMDDGVLELIGRKHTAKDVVDAFYMARSFGFDNINMDLISGLPGDDFDKFRKTIDSVLELEPENITLHTLTVKRSANLAGDAQKMLSRSVDEMNEHAFRCFDEAGYYPYYLYRQKGTVEALENTGFCKPGKEGIYNVFIMDETHSILATGAGGVTKLKDPHGPKIERIFNFKFPYEYIDRFDLMNERKEQVKDFYERHPL